MEYEKVKSKLDEIMPKNGDDTILDYIIGALSDEHFDFGDSGNGIYEDLGVFLVGGTQGQAWIELATKFYMFLGVFFCCTMIILPSRALPPADFVHDAAAVGRRQRTSITNYLQAMGRLLKSGCLTLSCRVSQSTHQCFLFGLPLTELFSELRS